MTVTPTVTMILFRGDLHGPDPRVPRSATPWMTAAEEPDTTTGQIAALRRELKLTWDGHAREHEQHEKAHGREHEFAQKAIETAAILAKENKADANEWRASMNDREAKFATKDDVVRILSRLDGIERSDIVAAERERNRSEDDAEEKRQSERRVTRSQWTIGLVVGLLATFGAILINIVIRT